MAIDDNAADRRAGPARQTSPFPRGVSGRAVTEAGSSAGGGVERFDPGRPYRRSPNVALRPEPFGALVYHYGTRRLSFLKTRRLVEVVAGLERHPDVHAAIEAAGVASASRPAYLRALAGLAEAGTIEPRADAPGADQPGADQPGADEPAADEPAADERAADEPGAAVAGAESGGGGQRRDEAGGVVE